MVPHNTVPVPQQGALSHSQDNCKAMTLPPQNLSIAPHFYLYTPAGSEQFGHLSFSGLPQLARSPSTLGSAVTNVPHNQMFFFIFG